MNGATMQEYWPTMEEIKSPTALYGCAQWRKHGIFLPAACELVASSDMNGDCDIITTLLRTRILPELNNVRDEDASQLRRGAVRLSLELLSKQHGEAGNLSLLQLCSWLRDEPSWKVDVETTLQEIVRQ